MKKNELVTHFPWQRLVMTILINLSMIGVLQKFVDWLYYFCTISPLVQPQASVITTAITALSAGVGIIFVCMAAVNIWFITGSNKTVEAMFKFNSAAIASSALNSVSQTIDEHRKEEIDQTNTNINIDAAFQTPELKERYENR